MDKFIAPSIDPTRESPFSSKHIAIFKDTSNQPRLESIVYPKMIVAVPHVGNHVETVLDIPKKSQETTVDSPSLPEITSYSNSSSNSSLGFFAFCRSLTTTPSPNATILGDSHNTIVPIANDKIYI